MDKKNKKFGPQESGKYIVPPGGSLGLLAYGYKGLEPWREARKKAGLGPQGGKHEPKKD